MPVNPECATINLVPIESICGGVQALVVGGLTGVVVAVIMPPTTTSVLVRRLMQTGSSWPGFFDDATMA